MRIMSLLKKSFIETLRDWKMFLLALIFGPIFILIFNAVYNGSNNAYSVVIRNADKGFEASGTKYNYGDTLIKCLKEIKASGGSRFKITLAADADSGRNSLKKGDVPLFMSIPEDFTKSIMEQASGDKKAQTNIEFYGDLTNQAYMIPAVSLGAVVENFVYESTGKVKPLNLIEHSLVSMENKKDFDAYVPFAILMGWIMVMFTACNALVKEVDEGTMVRLRLSGMRNFEFISSVTINQILISFIIVAITIGTAVGICNYKLTASILDIGVITLISTIGLVGMSIIVASFCRNTSDILIIGNLPYFLMMIFSGVFPIPGLKLFKIGSYSIGLSDLLSSTQTYSAYKKVLYDGLPLSKAGYEIAMILLLSLIYFTVGMVLFKRRHKI
ncbi:MAG: ABC transporter permease [Bacillota bacterium]|nr:ABC transporter permease [Bacillota bacterium]